MTYTAIDNIFHHHDGALNAAEAHGIAVGMLCVDLRSDMEAWQHEVVRDSETLSTEERDLLAQLFEQTRRLLQDNDYEFDLLLPDDDEDEVFLQQRAEALRDWCQGFLFGIGYTHSQGEWPGECNEVLRDIVEFSRLDPEAEGEEDENAFMQIQEYLRTAVFLIQQEFNDQRADKTQH